MRIKGLTEGALMVSVYTVLLLLSIYTPLFLIAFIFLPLPFTISTVRHGWKQGIFIAMVAVFITLIVSLPSILLTVMMALVGVTMGECYRRGRSAYTAFIWGLLASLGGQILTIFLTALLFDINIIEEIQHLINESVQTSKALLGQAGLAGNVDTIQQFTSMMTLMVPFMLLISSAQVALVNHWLTRKIAGRLGMEIVGFPPIDTWRLPTSLIWYYLILLLTSLLIPVQQGSGLHLILINAMPILQLAIMLQGLSFLAFLGKLKKWPKKWLVLFIIMMFLFPILFELVVLIGIMDLGFPIRSYFTNRG
ncbi:YybS family protein [Rubeoparvulum massiliense]|uniref:YybS family protein n=1 Tax=Rubeoparvulum massiliense TaxID=1631346 RepID=UPI00065DD867|nr:DUF2232 domain-containing protein [Rubeoparvulum massiliense]